MTSEESFSRETTIYVSTMSKLTVDQTQKVVNDLLRIMGYPSNYSGFKFQFIDAGNLVRANAFVDSNFKVSIGD